MTPTIGAPLFGIDARATAVPDAFWKSLGYFNFSHLMLAGVLLAAISMYGDTRVFGATDPALFYKASQSPLLKPYWQLASSSVSAVSPCGPCCGWLQA